MPVTLVVDHAADVTMPACATRRISRDVAEIVPCRRSRAENSGARRRTRVTPTRLADEQIDCPARLKSAGTTHRPCGKKSGSDARRALKSRGRRSEKPIPQRFGVVPKLVAAFTIIERATRTPHPRSSYMTSLGSRDEAPSGLLYEELSG